MPRTILDTTGPGPQQDWEVISALPGWEAVQRGSGDANRIRSQVNFDKGYFHCGAGWMPYYGEITAITLYYRARMSLPATTGTIYTTIIRHGIEEHQNGPIVLTSTNWVDSHIRVRADWIMGTRFNPFGVGDLGVGVFMFSSPTAGYVEVSELWLEVEYLDSTTVYDPTLTLSLPDALTGDMQWITNGTEIALITGSEQLSIFDNNPADYRSYERTDLVYPEQYVTELETRIEVYFVPFFVSTGFFYYIAAYDDGQRSVYLALYNVLDRYYVGLIGSGLDPNDPGAYLASYEINPFVGEDLFFRMSVDRDVDPGTAGRVRVYSDYTNTPALEVPYASFPTTLVNRILFGTGDPLTGVMAQRAGILVDFFSWHTYKKGGETFDMWREIETGPNFVEATHDDPYIWKPVELPVPQGVKTGQAEHACKLAVVDATEDCFMRQYWMMLEETPVTYDLNIDYRMDTLLADGKATLQRRSDHWYWDEGGSIWTAAVATVTLPNQMNRTRLTGVMTGITSTNIPPYDEVFILQIGKDSAVPANYQMFVYHADLEKS